MKLNDSNSDPDVQALLERARVIPQIPDVVRVRALARARATMAASAMAPSAPPTTRVPLRWLRIALTTSTAMALGVAGEATALHWRAAAREEASIAAPQRTAVPARDLPPDPPEALGLAPEPSPPARQSPRQTREAQESYAAEIALLQRAQAAYAGGSYSEALALVARHNRKFPNGRLAEEREGLRVRSLLGSGQTEEARRVVVAFNRRFPRSVLLPHLQEMMKARD